MHCANTRFLLGSGEIEDSTVAIEGVPALQVGLPSVLEGQLLSLEAFVLEEQLAVRIGRKGGQLLGFNDALGEGDGRAP